MRQFQFEDIINLTDDDLITLLKHIPNVTLLLAVLSVDTKDVATRLCQVLSFQAANYFLEDLEKFRLDAEPEKCKSARSDIEILVNDLVSRKKIRCPLVGRNLKMVS